MAEELPWVWMSTTDLVKYLGVTLRTVYRLIDVGDIPAYQLGRVIRCRKHEVDAYLEQARLKKGHLSARRNDVSKGAWTWTAAEEMAMQRRLEAFAKGYVAGGPVTCPLCGEVVGLADVAKHMLDH